MKILHLSDTHGLHKQVGALPAADVIVHTGDFTNWGTEDECLDFLNWLIELPYAQKIFVCGNHDFCLQDADDIEDMPANVHFLQDRSLTIDGVKFYGAGYMHYNIPIPPDTHVLLTHEPPRSILDCEDDCGIVEYGSKEILEQVFEIPSLQLHLFGHSHSSYGTKKIGGITFSNAALLANDGLRIAHEPHVIEI